MFKPSPTQSTKSIITAALLFISILTIADLMEDRAKGVGWGHLISEGIIVVLAVSSLLYLWWSTLLAWRQSHQRISRQLSDTRADLDNWRTKACELLSGLGKEIDEQFGEWSLTEAEKDVGLLLLKGFSLKEIAQIRDTSEKTVRQQAGALYRKANLDGRAQLSAFFLEDLLLPVDQEQRSSRKAG